MLKALNEQDSYQPGVAGMAALQEDRNNAHRMRQIILISLFFIYLEFLLFETPGYGFSLERDF